jgi:NAD(P)H-nitrite reductase large subunit
MDYVILGAGPAGVTAAETLRGLDRDARVTLVGGEPGPPYSRMAIPYLLQGNIEEKGTYLRQQSGHYDELGISYLQGPANAIDVPNKRLCLAGGAEVRYDKLLIATGASPVNPPIQGTGLPGVHSCWTLEDAREILKRAERGSSLVLLGAGFIGSIVLEALYVRGCQLTVVEIAPRMVARMMDDTAAGMLKRWCEAQGVRVLTGTRVERIASVQNGGEGADLRVSLSNGDTIPARLVVLAAGVRSNIDFLGGSTIAVNRGVRVDEYMQTSVPGIYAAGDCCEALDLSTGQRDVLAIQPTAVEHGRMAALNMAGVPTPHRGSLNMNVLDTMGLVSSSFGLWQGKKGGASTTAVDDGAYKYLRLEFDDDRLVGAQSVGLTDHVGILRGLIQTGLRLGAWRGTLLKAPERVREAYIATAQGIPAYGWTAPRVKAPA